MTDAAVVGRILREYRLGPVSARRRYGSVSGAWVGYELARPGNAVITPSGEAVLIGWEYGGVGPPVLDLGQCLLECHLDPGLPPGQPQAWHIEPDPGRIGVVLDGYARWRSLDNAERTVLAEAVRFGVAYTGAIHFERALIDGVGGTTMAARLGRLRNWAAASQAIAGIAARHLGAR